ncbi:MAG: LPS-assembly protein LptD [Deltaproteobacteria bacterium]|nr:LPS-assembly protein LptD [Deltaproteobacteria bacterium]
MGRYRVWAWAIILVFLSAGWAGSAERELFKPERLEGGPWWIRAEEITYDAASHTYTAQGRVEIRQGDRRLTADWVQVNEATKIARLRGNVVLVLGEDIFSGQEGEFNLVTRSGEMKEARLFLQRNHFQVKSSLIRKTGDSTYYAENSTITTCDADLPVWSFSARQLQVVLDGYATSQNTLLKLAGLPVLYFPYAVLPVKTERQSGFLLPQYGQHRAGGTVVEVPFYWAINNHADATLYQTVLTNRGYMQGGELRHRGHKDAAATIRAYTLSDGSGEAPVSHRYWVAGMVNQPLGDDWEFRGTVDRASDLNYLKDFNFGYMGLNRYSRELLADFGRNLEQEDVTDRVSTGLFAKNFSWANFTAFSRYYQRLRLDDPRAVHRLPGVSLTTLTLPVGKTPLQVGLDSSYTHFYQEYGLAGHRLDLHPQAWLQAQPLPGTSFTSRVGFRETLFTIDDHTPNGPQDNYQSRQLYDAKVSLASAWVRDYGRDSESPKFYRHLLRPEVTYWNIPRFDPARLPAFDPYDIGWVVRANRNLPIRDGDDPIGGVNALTYGFSNHLLMRDQNRRGQALVSEKLWVRLSQSVFFNTSSLGLDGTPQPHHRFSDFLGEIEYYPFRRLVTGLDLGVSPYKEGFNRANVKFTFLDSQRQHLLSVGYLFVKDFAKQINVSTYLNLFKSVKTWVTYSNTFETNNKLERQYGLVIQRQCWGVVFSYTDRPDDQRIGVSLYLPGIGERLRKGPGRVTEKESKSD